MTFLCEFICTTSSSDLFKTSFCLWAPSASRIFLGSKLQQVPSSQALLPLRSCQYLLGWGLNCRSFSHFTTKQKPAKNKNIPHSFRIEPFVLRNLLDFFQPFTILTTSLHQPPRQNKNIDHVPTPLKNPPTAFKAGLGMVRKRMDPKKHVGRIATNSGSPEAFAHPWSLCSPVKLYKQIVAICLFWVSLSFCFAFFQPSMNSEILRGTIIYSRAARSTCRKRFWERS